jgi:Flp pilus assembly protein TadG
MKPISSNSRNSHGQRGAVIAELALMLPLMAILVLGATDVGIIIREHQVLQNAAREGARFSAQPANNVSSSNPSATANSIRDRVIAYLAQERITIPTTDCTADGTEAKRWNCGDITIRQQSPITVTVPGAGGFTVTDYGSEVSVTYNRSFLFKGGSLFKFNAVSLTGRSVFHNLY